MDEDDDCKAELIAALLLLDRAALYRIGEAGAAGAFAVGGSEALFDQDYYRVGLVSGTAPSDLAEWEFGRPSPAFARTSAGVLQSFSAGVPRITDRGLLVESAATNLALHASGRTAPVWVVLNATVAENTAGAPDGTSTADKVVETTTSGIHALIQIGPAQAGATYVYSEYVRAAGRTKVRLLENNGPGADAVFDLEAGIVVSTFLSDAWIEKLADGWWRCSLRFTTDPGQNTWNCSVRLLDGNGSGNYAGDGVSGLFVWNAQVEAGTRPTSPIATSAVSVTRSADIVRYGASGESDGGLLLELQPAVPASTDTIFVNWSDGTGANRIVLGQDSQGFLKAWLWVGSEATSIATGKLLSPGEIVRIGARWRDGEFRLYAGGEELGRAEIAGLTLTTISLGADFQDNASVLATIAKLVSFSAAPTPIAAANMTLTGRSTRTCVRVAAVDSAPADRLAADFLCDGVDDQEEINAAIAAVADGGSVILADGQYLIRRTQELPIPVDPLPNPGVEVKGAILMTASNMSLVGQSRHGTVIRLDGDQRCNMIRTIGNGLRKIQIRSLTLDPNRENNLVSGLQWLENCGIKTRTTGSARNREIWISDIHVGKVDGVGVYLWGDDVHLRDSSLEAADNDVAELCDGAVGSIKGCAATILSGDLVGYGFGTDQFDDFMIESNITVVQAGGFINGAVHRAWPGNYRGAFVNNVVRCDVGGRIAAAFHAHSYNTLISGNVVRGHSGFAQWGKTRIELNTTVKFTDNHATWCTFSNAQSGAGVQTLPTSTAGVTRISMNNLETCDLPPDHPQLICSDNDVFTFS